jgi:hypothetical protein
MIAIHFSNDRLNFKHVFWAAASRQKGIFGAMAGFSTPLGAKNP